MIFIFKHVLLFITLIVACKGGTFNQGAPAAKKVSAPTESNGNVSPTDGAISIPPATVVDNTLNSSNYVKDQRGTANNSTGTLAVPTVLTDGRTADTASGTVSAPQVVKATPPAAGVTPPADIPPPPSANNGGGGNDDWWKIVAGVVGLGAGVAILAGNNNNSDNTPVATTNENTSLEAECARNYKEMLIDKHIYTLNMFDNNYAPTVCQKRINQGTLDLTLADCLARCRAAGRNYKAILGLP